MTITTHPVNTTQCVGEVALFTCVSGGDLSTVQSSDVVWMKFMSESGDYEHLEEGPRYFIFKDGFRDERTRLDSILQIKNVTVDDAGWYVFEIGGNVTSNRAYLNVIIVPGTISYDRMHYAACIIINQRYCSSCVIYRSTDAHYLQIICTSCY